MRNLKKLIGTKTNQQSNWKFIAPTIVLGIKVLNAVVNNHQYRGLGYYVPAIIYWILIGLVIDLYREVQWIKERMANQNSNEAE